MNWFLLSVLLVVTPTGFAQRCPSGWTMYQDSCFIIYTNWRNWYDARLACQAQQGDLPIITSVEMNTFLMTFTQQAGNTAWIGLNDFETEGTFQWNDGTALTAPVDTLWMSNNPNDPDGSEDCAALRADGTWVDLSCILNKHTLCQRPNDIPLKCDEANGWVSAGGKCHRYQNWDSTWDDARRYCQTLGGDLISIQTDEEQNVARLQVQANFQSIWIGASDKISNVAGSYTWPDGSALSMTNWAPGQPDNQFFSLGGNCAGILDMSTNGEWSTSPCTSQRKFICEKDEGTCPVGWRIHGGQCYQFNTYSAMTWTDAKHNCEAQGAFLASIFSDDENDFVFRQFDDLTGVGVTDIWIGISDYSLDGQFAWVDGASVSYNNWNPGMPVDTLNQPDCGTIYLGDSAARWDTANCFLLQSFICKVPVGQQVFPLDPMSGVGNCPTDWSLFGDFCFFVDTTQTSFNDAETRCETKGAKLASIHSAEVQSYLSLRTSMSNTNLWIGLHDRSNEGIFEWVDKTPLDFTNWNVGEPNDYGSGEDCVHLRPGETEAGTWNDLVCSGTNSGFICQLDKECEVLDSTSTDENYYYRYHPSQANIERVEFKVKAASDVHIGLSSASSNQPAMYEIIIGGWTNSNSAIRRCAQCPTNEVYISTPNFLSDKEFRGFWVEYDLATGKLDVGRQGQSAFMTWTDPSPLDVKYVGYSTGYGFSGQFQFCNLFAGVASTPVPRPTPAFDARCGKGWEYAELLGQCFWFAMSDYRTWADAREQCMLGGGDLISFVSATEQTYINARLVFESEPSAWIGANDISANGGWVWSDGSPFKFLNWNAGEPNDFEDGEHCSELYTSNGRWNDIPCERTMGYICKKDGYLVSHFTVIPNSYLQDVDVLVITNIYPEECAKRCVMETSFVCLSFDYDKNTKICALSDRNMDSVNGLFTAIGVDYYQLVPGIAPPTQPATLAPGYRCPAGWTSYGDYCYQAQPGDGTWTEALEDCRRMSADLISIHDSNENNYIVSVMLENGLTGQIWSGMSDTVSSLTFEWTDRSPVTFTQWAINEPNNYEGKNEDCVEIYTDGTWNDQDCEDRNHYICKQMKQNLGPTQFPITPNGCDSGWVAFESSCYKFEDASEVSWDQANNDCAAVGAHLIAVRDRFEQSFLASRLGVQNGQMFWIGMSETAQKGSYEWVNNDPITYTNWGRGQPDDSRGSCVASSSGVSSGLWSVANCDMTNNYVCESQRTGYTPAPVVTEPSPTLPTNIGCPVGWIGWGDNCFKPFQPANKKSFWDAEAQCVSLGANLASFHTPEEETYLKVQADVFNNEPFWIGLHDSQNEGGFEWTDGSVVSYTNWNDGEPNDYNTGEDCTEMFFDNRKWNDQSCNQLQGWVCKISRVMGCADGWRIYDDMCFLIQPQILSYNDARATCVADQADLAIITSLDMNTWLTRYVSASGNAHWIGLHDLSDENQFVWVDGTPLSSDLATLWDNGQPDNYGADGEDCTVLKDNGRWNDAYCTYNKPFVCQRPVVLCPDGWTLYKGLCYKLMPDQKTWNDARLTCQSTQGDLAKITSSELNSWLATKVGGAGGEHYIGLHDLSNEGRFSWTDGSSLDQSLTSLWDVSEPNNFGNGEDCVVLKDNALWNDLDCTALRPYICVRPYGDIPFTTAVPEFPVCPTEADWFLNGDSCFYFSTTVANAERKSWQEAEGWCNQEGGNLASVHGSDEQNFINNKMAGLTVESHWIGIREYEIEGKYTWSDNTPIDFENWVAGEPNDFNGEEQCGELYAGDGKWNDANCGIDKNFICRKNVNSVNPITYAPTPVPTGNCPSGSIKFDNWCYTFYGEQETDRKTWEDAREACEATSGYRMAVLHSAPLQAFLTTKLKGLDYRMWIGLSDLTINSQFVWIDGTAVDFTNWGPGEPNEAGDGEDCVEMYYDSTSAGEWNDVSCSKVNGYVCQSYIDPFLPPQLTPINPCPAGYSNYGNGCFKVLPTPMTFSDANAQCKRDDNVFLASIMDPYEQAYVETLLHDNGGTPVWIGMVDDKVEGMYQWVDGWPIWFTHWGRSEPSRGAGEGCVAMEPSGNWNDTRCSDVYYGVCKYSLVPLPTDHPDTPGYCPDNWSPYGSDCYYFQPEGQDLIEWPIAQFDCSSMGGQLADIHSVQENEFVRTGTKRSDSMWIGLYRSDTGGFSWEDNSGVDYVNWAEGEPSLQHNGDHENCVELYLNNGRWNDIDCKQIKSYVCKMPKMPITSAPGLKTDMQKTDPLVTLPGGVTKSPQKSTGVSTGVIIGIILAVLVAILFIGLVAFFMVTRASNKSKAPLDIGTVGFDNAVYHTDTGVVQVQDTMQSAAEA
ncbi:macrophage mannose receptor 1-like [Asterias rubens]|uniref:macrophage mannose receptor 1-like n=1 Tax=Asterias rubens TaxID=7604 RepID=UPI001455A9BE|nr:macrophage mannose receptor 1-like [Asterias rubens]